MTDNLKKAFSLFKEGERAWDATNFLNFEEFDIFLSKILNEKWSELKKRIGYSSEVGCFHCCFEIEDSADFFILFGVVLHKHCIINYLDDKNKWKSLREDEAGYIARAMGTICETNSKYFGNKIETECLKKANLI